jgi:hypothetical protein
MAQLGPLKELTTYACTAKPKAQYPRNATSQYVVVITEYAKHIPLYIFFFAGSRIVACGITVCVKDNPTFF